MSAKNALVFGQTMQGWLNIHMQKNKNNAFWQGHRETETLTYCWWDCKWCRHFGKQSVSSSKGQTQLAFESVIPLMGVHPREMKTCLQKKCAVAGRGGAHL